MSGWAEIFYRTLNERSLQERSEAHEGSLAAQDAADTLAWDGDRTPEPGTFRGIFRVRAMNGEKEGAR